MVFQIICFSIDCDISDPLFTHLWTLSKAFVLLQVKIDFDTPIFNYILPFSYKNRKISNIYQKYGESFFEIIPILVSYGMGIP